jgi:hypothetical protein
MFAWKLHPHIPAQTYGSNSILVTFTQTFALLSTVQLQWPPSLQYTFDIFRVALFELSLLRFDCVVPNVSNLQKTMLYLVAPVALLMMVCIIRGIIILCSKSATLKVKAKKFIISTSNLSTVIFIMTCFPVTKSLISTLDCVRPGSSDEYVMERDPSVVCFEQEWWSSYFALFIVALVVYGSVPVVINCYVARNKHLYDVRGFIYLCFSGYYFKYQRGCPLHENVVLLRKVACATTVVFLSPYPFRCMVVLTSIIAVSLTYQIVHHPYQAAENNALEIMCSGTLLVILGTATKIQLV